MSNVLALDNITYTELLEDQLLAVDGGIDWRQVVASGLSAGIGSAISGYISSGTQGAIGGFAGGAIGGCIGGIASQCLGGGC